MFERRFFLRSKMKQKSVEFSGAKIDPAVLKSVVRIDTPPTAHSPQALATGFIVSCPITAEQRDDRLLFLVTNKHVIGDWTLADGDIAEYRQYLNLSLYGGTGGAFTSVSIPLCDTAGAPMPNRVRLANNPYIDIAVVSLNGLQELVGSSYDYISLDLSLLTPFDKISECLIGVGDQVFALGYPLGITSKRTSYPIAKAGYLAAMPGENFSIDFPTTRRNGTTESISLDAKIIIVDGLIVPGNSGGPLVLPSELKVRRNPKTKEVEFGSRQLPNFILGVVSAGLGNSGLTICYSSDYVLEIIGAFSQACLPVKET